MANLTIGSKAILRSLSGAIASGFTLGETVVITHNPLQASREKGRISFTKVDGTCRGYANAENLIPVNAVETIKVKGDVNVVKVELEGAKFEGKVEDVLAVIKGLQDLANVAPATTAQFAEVKIEKPEPVIVKLGDKVGVGTKIRITNNRKHGELNYHGFKVGDIVEVVGNVGTAELEQVAVRAEKGYDTWTVHQNDFEVYVAQTPSVGMLAYIKEGKANTGCLHGFKDGQLVEILRIDGTEYKPIKVAPASDHDYHGYADVDDLELLF